MSSPLIQCPKCRAWLVEGIFNQPDFTPCPACGVPLLAEAFPALFRKIAAGQSAEPVMVEGESSCFYHPEKKAVAPCDGCGRFLCALCDCLLHGQHFCPACLETGATKGKIKSLENYRPRYDEAALALAILPLLVTAPIAIFVAIRYWNAPGSIVRRTKARFILAIILAILQIGVWVLLFSMA
ncbi:MAG TPA: B-box zinc finger protein [Candidatus Sulfotelmatobacter sp.]|nr:B-box zinc finger protein [Candidatus Sulfotelmatobacter sp.]